MTFSEYIISERSKNFYLISLKDIIKYNSTLEEWFSDMYYDWNILHNSKQLSLTEFSRIKNIKL